MKALLAAMLLLPASAAGPAASVETADFSDEAPLRVISTDETEVVYQVFKKPDFSVRLIKRMPGTTRRPYMTKSATLILRLGKGSFINPMGVEQAFEIGDVSLQTPAPSQIVFSGKLKAEEPVYMVEVRSPPDDDQSLALARAAEAKRRQKTPNVDAMMNRLPAGQALALVPVIPKGGRPPAQPQPFTANLLVANRPSPVAASAGETVWIGLEGTAQVQAGARSVSLKPRTLLYAPKDFGQNLKVIPAEGRFAALIVTISPEAPAPSPAP